MNPKDPYLPVEDFRKICLEINQINNQRFLVCLAGISFVGAFGWALFPKTLAITEEAIKLSLLNAILLQLILLIACAKSQVLRMKARCLAGYLRATGTSVWEADLAEAKNDTRVGKYTSLEAPALHSGSQSMVA